MVVIQASRRTYETLFVSSYSNSKMNVVHYLVGFYFYFAMGLSLLSKAPDLNRGNQVFVCDMLPVSFVHDDNMYHCGPLGICDLWKVRLTVNLWDFQPKGYIHLHEVYVALQARNSATSWGHFFPSVKVILKQIYLLRKLRLVTQTDLLHFVFQGLTFQDKATFLTLCYGYVMLWVVFLRKFASQCCKHETNILFPTVCVDPL